MKSRVLPDRRRDGFSLAEGIIAVAVLSCFVLVCFSSITLSRVMATKSKEQGIAMDFLVHYAELIRALPFNEVIANGPINPLLDGSLDSPNIRIPAGTNWVALNTDDFETFHPDLMWIHHRNPQLRVVLTTETRWAQPHTKHLSIRMEWDAPVRRGTRLHQETDVIRVKDL